jgi:anti-sigma B factor antagonist/stage II sporulation protein AA (anti-sigma F factor antagonist)
VEISRKQFAEVVVIAPVGRVDQTTAGELEATLTPLWEKSAVDKSALVLDFTGVGYISSVGLRVLMIAAKRMRAGGARIAIAALQPVVAEIFAISRFDRVLEVFPSLRGALESLSSPALEAFDMA